MQAFPPTVILNKIKQYSPSNNLKLLTRKDIYNVARDSVDKLPQIDDLKSVDTVVHKMIEEDYNPVLEYKPL